MHGQELDDYIGAESCLDFSPDIADVASNGGAGMNRPRRQRRSDALLKEYPPSIPSLARTENLPGHMPWVMKKYSTRDGRVVIREEKVRRHEYFQAHRSNGRRVLSLVPLDDAVAEICKDHRVAGDEGVEKLDLPENVAIPEEETNGGDACISDSVMEELHSESKNYSVIGINPGGGFGVAVAAFTPPVHNRPFSS